MDAHARATVGLLVLSGALVAAFLYVDRRRPAAVLPPSAFRAGPLKWIYLTLGLLMAATMADMYVPLFGQRLAHLTPVAAGFLGAGLAIGGQRVLRPRMAVTQWSVQKPLQWLALPL